MPSRPCPKKRWPHLLAAAAAVALLGAAPSQAAVVTIDFGTGADAFPASPYQEDGFNVVSDDLRLDNNSNPGGGIFLTSTLTISSISGATFSFSSLDSLCTDVGEAGCPSTFGVQGTLAGGGTTAQVTVSSDPGWETARAFAGFTNLSSLTLSPGSGLSLIDNIVLNAAAVPLPAALPLLATALGGLGLARWRRQQHVKPLRPATA